MLRGRKKKAKRSRGKRNTKRKRKLLILENGEMYSNENNGN